MKHFSLKLLTFFLLLATGIAANVAIAADADHLKCAFTYTLASATAAAVVGAAPTAAAAKTDC